MININETVKAILSTPDVQFKVFKTEKETGNVMLTTAVNDEFNRGVIIVEKDRVAIGTQGPDADGKLNTVFQPVTLELIDKIVRIPEPKTPVKGVPAEEAPVEKKTPKDVA